MGAALTAVAEASRRDANQAGAVIVVILKGACVVPCYQQALSRLSAA